MHHAGMVAIIGRPNVGKSTLVNALLGQKIAAVSPRPQTTRRRQLGILTLPETQIVFIDTPGLHEPVHRLGDYMNAEAAATLDDADVLVWMVDVSQPPQQEDRLIAARLLALQPRPPVLLAINKIDLVNPTALARRQEEFLSLLPDASGIYPLSAPGGQGRNVLLKAISALLPEGEPFYSEDQVTDLYEREIAADLIRQACLDKLEDELPHAIAVRIDEYKERSTENAFIAATLFVERESHKGIVIGKGGEMLKHIGSAARREIETMTGQRIFLELRVKVHKNWRQDGNFLKQMGYGG